MSDSYYRPVRNQQQRTELVIDKSHFITTVTQARTTETARSFIQEMRDEMPDANHHVYGFCIGYGNSVTEGMSDDGEPSGTSGPPTLAVLRGSNLGDIALVTTRYFGGIKLGTGGLVRAYTDAAQLALEHLTLELKSPRVQIGFDIAYTHYKPAKRLLNDYQGHLDDEIFAGDVTLIVTLPRDAQSAFESSLQELTHGQAETILLKTIDQL